MTLYDRIKFLCKTNNIAITALEQKLGFGRCTISKWDKSQPTIDKLATVADYFGVSIDYLLGKTQDNIFDKLLANPQTLNMLNEYYYLKDQTQMVVQQLVHEMYQLQHETDTSISKK